MDENTRISEVPLRRDEGGFTVRCPINGLGRRSTLQRLIKRTKHKGGVRNIAVAIVNEAKVALKLLGSRRSRKGADSGNLVGQ